MGRITAPPKGHLDAAVSQQTVRVSVAADDSTAVARFPHSRGIDVKFEKPEGNDLLDEPRAPFDAAQWHRCVLPTCIAKVGYLRTL